MLKKIGPLVALLLVSAPMVFAHEPPGPNIGCNPTQNPHDYGLPGSWEWDVVGFGGGVGFAGANDHNTQDCDGDGEPGDFDGDPEHGTGGGFLPAGEWADVCGYVPHHGGDFHVHDAVLQPNDGTSLHESVGFTVGADPSPPTIAQDPTTGRDACIDDGCICVGELDPDDWLQACVHACIPSPPAGNTNPSYGAPGGDGGYWVFVECNVATNGGWDGALVTFVDADGDGIPEDVALAPATPPTTVGVGCSGVGHIFSGAGGGAISSERDVAVCAYYTGESDGVSQTWSLGAQASDADRNGDGVPDAQASAQPETYPSGVVAFAQEAASGNIHVDGSIDASYSGDGVEQDVSVAEARGRHPDDKKWPCPKW